MYRRAFVVAGIVECLQPDRGGWDLIDSHGAGVIRYFHPPIFSPRGDNIVRYFHPGVKISLRYLHPPYDIFTPPPNKGNI